MTMILLHLNDERFARIDIDPASIVSHNLQPDFAVIDEFKAQLFELPGPIVTQETYLGTLLDRRPRIGEDAWTLTVSCGTSESYQMTAAEIDGRVQPVLSIAGEEIAADSLRLIDLLEETQKHFATRVPRGAPN